MATNIDRAAAPIRAGALALLATGAVAPALAASLFVYQARVVADVSLGGRFFQNADVAISFIGDASTVSQVPGISSSLCSGPSFYWLPQGDGFLKIVSGGESIGARFASGQLFAALDTCNLGIGIGSYIGPRHLEPGYPIAFARGSAGNTSASPSALSTASNTSGNAWSCVGYPPTYIGSDGKGDGLCADPTPYPLHTDRGDFFIYMPYTVPPPFSSNRSASLNRGTFSIWAAEAE